MSNEIENKLDAIEKNLLKTIADIEKLQLVHTIFVKMVKVLLEILLPILILSQNKTNLVLILLLNQILKMKVYTFQLY